MKWEQASLSQVLKIFYINNKNSSVGMLPRDTSCMLYQGLGCFFLGIIFTSLFLRMQGQSPAEFSVGTSSEADFKFKFIYYIKKLFTIKSN